MRIATLQYAIGILFVAFGALIMLDPNRFPNLTPLKPFVSPTWLGVGLLAGGLGLMGTAVIRPRFRFVVAAHVLATASLVPFVASGPRLDSISGTLSTLVVMDALLL